MKHLICLLAAMVLVLACGSDVTGPVIEDPPPDTTWEHTVTLHAEVMNYPTPKMLHIFYMTFGEVGDQSILIDTLVTEWEIEFGAAQGDSLYLYVNGYDNPEDVLIYCSIFIDGVWVASSGPPDLSGSCTYEIP